MTRVAVHLQVPASTGAGAPGIGRLQFTPTARRNVDTTVVLPSPFSVPLDTLGHAQVDLAATDHTWCWRVDEIAQVQHTRYVTVPEAEAVEYSALVEVDPETLDPVAVPEAAWWLALQNQPAPDVGAWLLGLPRVEMDSDAPFANGPGWYAFAYTDEDLAATQFIPWLYHPAPAEP